VTTSAAPLWQYDVRLDAGKELVIEGRFQGQNDGVFAADDDAAPFMSQVEVAQGKAWLPAVKRAASWLLPCNSGCTIRYRFGLRQAADALAEADTAIASGEVLIAPPSTWLLHPGNGPKNADFELSVEPGPGARFVSAFRPVADGRANQYRAAIAVLDDASFAAFGPLHVSEIPAGDTTVQLGVATHGLALSNEQAEAWVAASAGAVASYYQGHLPARRTLLLLMKGSGESTRGITLGGGGPGVLVRASDLVTPTTTREDWVVTHELLHANFPDIGPEHSWLSEGLATYLEPIARARVGLLDEAKVWRDMVDGMPQGLPQAGDRGLENTRTWGRTYWGGALFCLLADVELREKTGNQRSLDDVLLAIGKTGASDQDYWPIERVLEVAERATGTKIVGELFERLAKKPGTVDLTELFGRLGVRREGASVAFDERAPLARLRQAITARRPG
jgi:predicted metalloprotease with PDZ domain